MAKARKSKGKSRIPGLYTGDRTKLKVDHEHKLKNKKYKATNYYHVFFPGPNFGENFFFFKTLLQDNKELQDSNDDGLGRPADLGKQAQKQVATVINSL